MIYNGFFGLSEDPFGVTPDPKFLYMSKRHEEALAHLMFAIEERKGFAMLTGEVGSGKTTLVRYLTSTLDEKTHTAVVLNPKVNSLDLLALIVEDFGVKPDSGVGGAGHKGLMEALNKFLLECFERDERAVLLIDEAQEMDTECLEFIRLLSNLETDTRKLLQVVLIGQPELRKIIKSARLRQLDQRISVRYHIEPLSEEETSNYIKHRLGVAGAALPFPQPGVKVIHRTSRGIPRLINLYCDRTLMHAYANGNPSITEKLIRDTIKEIDGPSVSFGGLGKFVLGSVLTPRFGLMAVLTITAVAAVLLFSAGFRIGPVVKNVAPKTNAKENPDRGDKAVPEAEKKPPLFYLSEDVYKTSDYARSEEASILNILLAWGEKDLDTDGPSGNLNERGYSVYEFGDAEKIKKFGMPVVLRIRDEAGERSVVLRWLVAGNSLIIDPVAGKIISPFGEIKKKIKNIKLPYKNKYNTLEMKQDPEKAIKLSKDALTPELKP